MRKIVCFVLIIVLISMIIFTGCLVRDHNQLQDNIIRLHVVAASDSEEDQQLKLTVRDAILEYLQASVENHTTKEEAYQYIYAHLPQLESLANQVLQTANSDQSVSVSLQSESFDTRYYDTFTLPAGVYSSLRINIGKAEGKNWWCVVFPSLCLPTDVAGFEDTAAAAGFDAGLRKTIANESGYEIRFYLLDLVGKIENFFKTSVDAL